MLIVNFSNVNCNGDQGQMNNVVCPVFNGLSQVGGNPQGNGALEDKIASFICLVF
jgi:hypothetical protein